MGTELPEGRETPGFPASGSLEILGVNTQSMVTSIAPPAPQILRASVCYRTEVVGEQGWLDHQEI